MTVRFANFCGVYSTPFVTFGSFISFPRCSLATFYKLSRAIENHHVFQSSGRKPQRPAFTHLAVFLHHFGAPNRNHLGTARECHVAAGSVYLYVDRVITAISTLRNQYVAWPRKSDERLHEVKSSFQEMGFPGCVGLIDGCLMELAFVPKEDPMIYYCRKKFYGVNCQLALLRCVSTLPHP